MRKKNKIISLLLIITAFVLFACSVTGCDFSWSDHPDSGDAPYNIIIKTSDAELPAGSFSDVVASVRTTCVDVYCAADDSFGKSVVSGSGVIFASAQDGKEYYIITNHHVIEDQRNFIVRLLFIGADGSERNEDYPATLIGGSKSRDIAVLRITKKANETIPTATFGDSNKVRVGDDVFAIGNPLGVLGGTVSKGIISAKSRETYLDGIGYMTLLQTDTATYQGSSGGALFNLAGQVIGITNSGYSDYDGLNFAIPSEDALEAATSLLETVVKNSDGTVKSYGYVEGDSNFGLYFADAQCYTDSNLNQLVSVVYLLSKSEDCPASNLYSDEERSSGKASYIHSVYGIAYDGKFTAVATATELQNLLSDVSAGTTVTFYTRRIQFVTSGSYIRRTTYAYLGQEENINVTAVQYIYTPPTV